MKARVCVSVVVLLAASVPLWAGHYTDPEWSWNLVPHEPQVQGTADWHVERWATGAGGSGEAYVECEAWNPHEHGGNDTPNSEAVGTALASGTGSIEWVPAEGQDEQDDPPEDVEASATLGVSAYYHAFCLATEPCQAKASGTATACSLGVTAERPYPEDLQEAHAKWDGDHDVVYQQADNYIYVFATLDGAGTVSIHGSCNVSASAWRASDVANHTHDSGFGHANATVSMSF